MLYTMLGVLGFVSFLAFDILSIKHHVLGKYVFLLAGIGLIGYSSIHIILYDQTMLIPNTLRYIALSFSVVFLVLLVYSVFIEVGLNTYEFSARPELVTNGTYTLVRHPGVIWLFLTYVFGAIYFANGLLLLTAFVWTMVNTMYILLQERWILRKLFAEYDRYTSSTPMIIPTITSVRRFMTLQNWRRE